MTYDVPDGIEAQLAEGLATALDAWGLVTYATEYEPDVDRPLYLGADEPANAPAERVLLIVNPMTPAPANGARVGLIPVSLNYRGAEGADELDALNFVAMVRRRLHRLAHYSFGAVPVGLVLQTSAGSIGRDGRRRPGATANYLFRGRFAGTVNT